MQGRFARQVSNRAPQHLSCLEVGSGKACFLTMRAPDKWESPRFQGVFLASGFSLLPGRIHARPLAGNAGR